MGEPAGNWKEIGKVFWLGEPLEIGGNKEKGKEKEQGKGKGKGGTPGGTNGGDILSAAFRN